ncbi:hypothetical protein Gorai_001636 [Gossypium raimondii]|uniref:Uncharacterized protein n=1 Tax=Gossypium raimondii TaxID=29730 RepID=A0A7J8PGX9_GOSRA|nr:hypothetical protein [Gossypium raimondii]
MSLYLSYPTSWKPWLNFMIFCFNGFKPTSLLLLPLAFEVIHAHSTLSMTRKGLNKLSVPLQNFAARSLLPSLRSWGHHFQYVFGEDSDKMEIIKEEFTNHDRIWAVGPLLPIKATNNERGAPSSIPRDQVIEWLDSCNRDNSVMLISLLEPRFP